MQNGDRVVTLSDAHYKFDLTGERVPAMRPALEGATGTVETTDRDGNVCVRWDQVRSPRTSAWIAAELLGPLDGDHAGDVPAAAYSARLDILRQVWEITGGVGLDVLAVARWVAGDDDESGG